jgi:N-methylhydantoinase A
MNTDTSPIVGDLRLGVDIGGTFTDAILISEDDGRVWGGKVLTTPHDPSEGFLQVVAQVLARSAADAEGIRSIIHATTVATNAVIERQGARAGLLVTHGFRDILEIARQIRHELYNLQTDKPTPLIPRKYCREVVERLDYTGSVIDELDEDGVRAVLTEWRDDGINSLAVCLLHSYRNPVHEQRIRELAAEVHPEADVSLSSEIAPEIREYWRASTTVMNAYIGPAVRSYVGGVQTRLRDAAISAPLYLMQSNGGVTSVENARDRPVYLIESGPAAGVAAATHFCNALGARDAIAFDMGGTTAKMGLIRNGRSEISAEFEVGAGWSGTPMTRGGGYPILGSVVDLVEVGAGGGSIGWIDDGGALRVGPRSAGANPGPACYGRGGTLPTVTDANLVLGRLDARYFAGGDMALDERAAYVAIEKHCAEPLGLDVDSAAMGLLDIANATMVQAMRLVSVQRGHDPRDFTLVATGGAGPLHANALAQELGIPTIVVPPSPGVASALGMLVSDLRRDLRVTRLESLETAPLEEIDAAYRKMEAESREAFAHDGLADSQMAFERFMEMRYAGQSWKLRVAPPTDLSPASREELKSRFDAIHHKTYGYDVPEEDVEIVNIGITAIGSLSRPRLEHVVGRSKPRERTSRDVYFRELGERVACEVVDRYQLTAGDVVEGPAVIEETDSTTIVYPGYRAAAGEHGVLLLSAVEQ